MERLTCDVYRLEICAKLDLGRYFVTAMLHKNRTTLQNRDDDFLFSSDVRCYPQFRVEGLSESDQDALTLQSLQAYFSFKRRVLQQLSVCAICLATCEYLTGCIFAWKVCRVLSPHDVLC